MTFSSGEGSILVVEADKSLPTNRLGSYDLGRTLGNAKMIL